MKKRIIIDTNIWISYFLNQQFEDVAELVLENNLIVFSSIDLIDELRNVLSRNKFKKQITLPIERYINFHKERSAAMRRASFTRTYPFGNAHFSYP